jgi:hypothetical protein
MSNLLGDAPYRCLKHLEKSDDEENPHASAIYVRERLENPVKVERRKEHGTRHRLQAQRLSKVAHDVIDRLVDHSVAC